MIRDAFVPAVESVEMLLFPVLVGLAMEAFRQVDRYGPNVEHVGVEHLVRIEEFDAVESPPRVCPVQRADDALGAVEQFLPADTKRQRDCLTERVDVEKQLMEVPSILRAAKRRQIAILDHRVDAFEVESRQLPVSKIRMDEVAMNQVCVLRGLG